jgi:hypothetical protein
VIHRFDTGLVLISIWLLRRRKPSQQENDSEVKQSLDHNDLRANASLRCIPALERLGADSRVSLWMAANNPGFAAYVRQDQPNQVDCF